MAKVSSAVQATWPFTVALHVPMPTGPRRLVSTHSISSTSPGTTLRRKRAFFTPPNRASLALVLRQGQNGHAAHLGHGLQNQHAGHHVLLGEVAAEEGLVDADALDALGPLAGLVVGDPVHQGEGVAVGQDLRDLIGIELAMVYASHFFSRMLPLWPPKPRELDRA